MLDPTLAALILERIPGKRYGVFFSTGEGLTYPNGWEECSGSVVTQDGHHYDYWTGWDGEAVVLTQWQRIYGCREAGCWAGNREYLDARREAGLPA